MNQTERATGPENFTAENTDGHKKDFYQAARAEIVQRLSLRDQSLFAYIVAAGTYVGFVVQPNLTRGNSVEDVLVGCAITFVLPVLSLVFAYVILQHHIMIGRLGDYIRNLYPEDSDHWDNYYLSWTDRAYLTARTVSQALLLIFPVSYAGIFFFINFQVITSSLMLSWIAGITASFDLLVIIIIIRLHVHAYNIRRQTDWPKPSEEPATKADN